MFGTIGGRGTWRAMALFLAGAALAATLIAPVAAGNSAASAPSVTTYTRSASCAGLSFYPNDSATGYGAFGTLRTPLTGGYFLCDPGLPNGAVVTKVQFTVRDNRGSADVTNCALVRTGLTPATAASAQLLAGPLSTSGTPDVVRLEDASIDFAIIRNTSYGYYLQCNIGDGGSDSLGIYGANVTYRISAANG